MCKEHVNPYCPEEYAGYPDKLQAHDLECPAELFSALNCITAVHHLLCKRSNTTISP